MKYCTEYESIPDCPYYEKNDRIEDDRVIKQFIDSTEILEIEYYKKELGKELIDSIVQDWNKNWIVNLDLTKLKFKAIKTNTNLYLYLHSCLYLSRLNLIFFKFLYWDSRS